MAALDAEIAELEATIAREFAALGLRPADFPASGPVALATLLAEAGDVRRFPPSRASWPTSGGARRTPRAGVGGQFLARAKEASGG